jgi:hypothetical protein
VPEPHSRGLIGGIASVVGQAVRGEKQGQAWENVQNNTALQQKYQNQYSKEYRGKRSRRGRNNSDAKVGIISTPIGLVKKVLKKVSLCFFYFPTACTLRSTREGKRLN